MFRFRVIKRPLGFPEAFEHVADGDFSAQHGATIPIEPLGSGDQLHSILVNIAEVLYSTAACYSIDTVPLEGFVYRVHRNG